MKRLLVVLLIPLALAGCIGPWGHHSSKTERPAYQRPCYLCKGSGWRMGMTCSWCKGAGIFP